MPELPEVEAARRALEAHCVGRRIARCAVADDAKVVVGVTRVAFERAMVGRTIVAARRRGKNLWLRLDAPPFPSFQFGMAGAIYIKGVPVTQYKRSVVSSTDEWPSKYSKFFVELDDGLEFSFTDKRRFARVRLFEDPEIVPPISELGSDALFEPMCVDTFADSLSGKKIGIKALLLDQSFISGIGNWIADEVLYQSRTHPLQIASSLSRESCEALHRSIQEVVKYAVEVDADCDRFPEEWLFHHRWGKKPGKVNGKKIEFITAGGRTTAYVPQLQKLTGMQSASNKLVVSNPKQVAENDDAKGIETDSEDADNTRKRVATSKAARGKQNSDAIGAGSRKRKNGGGKEKPSSDDGEDDTETAELDIVSINSKGEIADPVTRRSSRNTSKPRQVFKSKGR
ncbi:formamidopyrimidine-DNA glycosylase-like [Oryza brachyantha]|uniref:Formamidopyrimidine-DNA glycosylase catalytic domain-containing protein n=1 Tax=Oryza brachyantha TaxID=4533 RepID=J3MG73_ORYBR|nr:formamidopyrimidine-DNA glycosylase-like [Oryza brachyantha]